MHTAVHDAFKYAHRCASLSRGLYSTPLCITLKGRLSLMAKRKNPAAVALGRKGGKNSRANLTPEQRKALARKAAAARWSGKSGPKK
jgi:hypothetical protein